jgi:hypothetical protein
MGWWVVEAGQLHVAVNWREGEEQEVAVKNCTKMRLDFGGKEAFPRGRLAQQLLHRTLHTIVTAIR